MDNRLTAPRRTAPVAATHWNAQSVSSAASALSTESALASDVHARNAARRGAPNTCDSLGARVHGMDRSRWATGDIPHHPMSYEAAQSQLVSDSAPAVLADAPSSPPNAPVDIRVQFEPDAR